MKSKNKIVLDASALLALLNKEKGHEKVAAVIDRATMNTVNIAEVITKLAQLGIPLSEIEMIFTGLNIDLVDFDMNMAILAGNLIMKTHEFGLSLGDRACLAFAESQDYSVVTADKAWQNVQSLLPIKIIFIR
ncbi:type II toxin-antitoxin system VapC family toxin [Pleurocapsa sp. FMAR1]|uniref:type II toxin-antitoxin system VapC family toxin n=1 Tax=Pleurocapsa sp. FMAR1 TaxID=3040204 RepID=UPI0029C68363|nr:type II toxin-antitoxin system VapC family toxin [Pleurocapsa sp. FMAR1]